MRHRHNGRIGRRRDGGVRQIRSDGAVRYPGVELPAQLESEAEPAGADVDASDAGRLSPVRDTGIALQTRLSRQQQTAARRQRVIMLASIFGVALVIAGTIGWRYVSDRMAAATPLTMETTSTASIGNATGQTLASHANANASPQAATAAATPIFASYGKLKLHLPVPMAKLTEIGFHQASYAWALHMKTPLKDANIAKAAKYRSTGRDLGAEPSGPNAVMTGYVIRMWRNRPGRPDTAADVGALAGTTVLSPVSGNVVKIRSYKLYGKYPDFEIHIHPDNTTGIDVVLIHLTNLSAAVGDHVTAGITPLAKIRKFSDKFHDQLADYTRGGGDHVHVQVNNADFKGYKGLVGAISVPYSGSVPTSHSAAASSGTVDGSSDAEDTEDYTSGD